VPVGQLFAGAVIPGFMLIALFIIFIMVIAWLRPEYAPAIDVKKLQAERGDNSLWVAVLTSLLPPLILVVAVLGSIFFGIASPTESAAIGALGALLLAVLRRRLSFSNLQKTMQQTTRMTSMVFLILIGATTFGLVFRGMGGDMMVEDIMMELPGGVWGFLLVSMLIIFLLGFFLDFIEICFIVVPIIAPIAVMMEVDLVWFAILIAMNLQTSFLTPPFGFSLFYLKAVAPKAVKITQIYRGVIPFIVIQLAVLGLLIAFPNVVTWLPQLMDEMQGFG